MKPNEFGALFVTGEHSASLMFALVATDGIYQLESSTANKSHTLSLIKSMRGDHNKLTRYLSVLGDFKWYSHEVKHLPGIKPYLVGGRVDTKSLPTTEPVNTGTNLDLVYLGEVNVDHLHFCGVA